MDQLKYFGFFYLRVIIGVVFVFMSRVLPTHTHAQALILTQAHRRTHTHTHTHTRTRACAEALDHAHGGHNSVVLLSSSLCVFGEPGLYQHYTQNYFPSL